MFVGIEAIVGSILFLLILPIITNTFLSKILLSEIGSLFVVILMIAVLNGIILYWINIIFIPKFKINKSIQTLCEYIIQWSLIYITVYQVVFENIISSVQENKINIEKFNITNPSDLIILTLPALISVWISIILYKIKENSI